MKVQTFQVLNYLTQNYAKISVFLKNPFFVFEFSGVLRIEIDPLQPKVSIFGNNIDPQILIKKLHKAGKQAQFWSQINYSAPKENKKLVADDDDDDAGKISVVQPLMSISKPSASIFEQEESSDKSKQISHSNGNNNINHDTELANFLQNQRLQWCYALAVPTLMATPPGHRPPPSCCPDHHHQLPVRVLLPSSETTSQVADFFSEDNTVGCYLM